LSLCLVVVGVWSVLIYLMSHFKLSLVHCFSKLVLVPRILLILFERLLES
jgi:hypothetical protein